MNNETLEIRDADQIKALFHPIRKQIMGRLMQAAATPSDVAKAIGLTANKVHYHVRILEKAGLVRLVNTRSIGAVKELYFEPAAQHMVIRPDVHDMDLATMVTNGIDTEIKELLRDLRSYQPLGDHTELKEGVHFSFLHVTADQSGKDVLQSHVTKLLETFDRAKDASRGRSYRLMMALVPSETSGEDGGENQND